MKQTDEPDPHERTIQAGDLAPRPDRRRVPPLVVAGIALALLASLLILSLVRRTSDREARIIAAPTEPAVDPQLLASQAEAEATREAQQRALFERARALAARRAERAAREQGTQHSRRPVQRPPRSGPVTSRYRTLSPLGTGKAEPGPRRSPTTPPHQRADWQRDYWVATEEARPTVDEPASRPVPATASRQWPRGLFLRAGTSLMATLLTQVVSERTGPVLAVVNHDVYSSDPQRTLLIPVGTRILGFTGQTPARGDRRLDIAWQRLHFPDGSSLVLENTATVDGRGAAGVEDRVNHRWPAFYLHAFLTSVTGAAAQLSQPQRSSAFDVDRRGQDAAAALGRNLAEVTRTVADQNLQRAPQLEIRPGHILGIMLTEDLVFQDEDRFFEANGTAANGDR